MIKHGNIQFNKEDVQYTVNYLNQLLEIDKDAIVALINHRVYCNNELGNHPTCQCQLATNRQPIVGMLGILNGLFGIDKDGWGPITMLYYSNYQYNLRYLIFR